MKAVLSPFRRPEKERRKQPSASAAAPHHPSDHDDLDWDDSKSTETAWTTATRARIRGTFGSKVRAGGPFRALKLRATRAPQISSTDMAVELPSPSPENNNIIDSSRKALIMDSPIERSQDFENLLNPPPRRRFSHLGAMSAAGNMLHHKEPMRQSLSQSSLMLRESSMTTLSTTDESNGILEGGGSLLRGSSEEASLGSERETKKYRTRRLSIEGAIAPLSMSQHSSFSHLAASAQDWKLIEGNTPPKQGTMTDSSGSPCRSVASTRKRGVGGSPLFLDNDDMSSQGAFSGSRSSSSTSARPIRRRSRIFSPDGPVAPLLPFSLPAMDSIANNNMQHSSSPTHNERGVMDIDSDHDSGDDASEPGSPDTSLDLENNTIHPEYEVSQHVETEHDVLDSMSSFAHLKFLVRALRSEAKGAPAMFGEKTSWTVAPQQTWHPSRRAEFYQWATAKLGFTVRAVGNSSSYLHISKQKGTKVLEKLTKALILYKEAESGMRQSAAQNISVPTTFTLTDRFHRQQSSMTLRRRSSMSMLPSPKTMSYQPFQHDDITALDLASKLQDLSVYEGSPRRSDASSRSQPLVRIVTLEAPMGDFPSSARTSLEHSLADAQDIMYHMQGRESVADDMSFLRPPRNSNVSVHSTGSHRSSAPFPTIGAAQSFDCLETPCMNGDKNWGSCLVEGRDWGESERCGTIALDVLLARFDDAAQQAGVPILPIRGMSSALKFEEEMECEPEKTVDVRMSDSPENKTVVRFDATSPEPIMDEKGRQKRRKSFAKLRRISLCYQLAGNDYAISQTQSTALFSESCPRNIDAIRDRITSEVVEMVSDEYGTIEGQADKMPLEKIFAFLTEPELKKMVSLVSRSWADAAAVAHATLMAASVAYLLEEREDQDVAFEEAHDDVGEEDIFGEGAFCLPAMDSVARSMERPWRYLVQTFPWGRYLAEGGMKKVYKTYNSVVGAEEAVAVMDVEDIREKSVIAAELAVSSMLSDLVRRGVCPNFVLIRGVFNCPYAPPTSHWGSEKRKTPKGTVYDPRKNDRLPREPIQGFPGRYHYIRMELCDCGDAEEYIKAQPNAAISCRLAQSLLFQTAFALHAAADRCSMKHYDIKLLNLFLQGVQTDSHDGAEDVILRYGLGSHVFALNMPVKEALIAKLADYGTANVKPESNGQLVTIGQFTTIENTPPDFMMLGDRATQGHGHDNWGLGLAMLHLFTGDAPYEEILEDVTCPPALKKRLRKVWEDDTVQGYEVLRSVILSDVELDEAGHIAEGEPDETPYDTLYRGLVLFGIPDDTFRRKDCPKVWDAIIDTLVGTSSTAAAGRGQGKRRGKGPDSSQYFSDCRKFSIRKGNNKSIARARKALESMDGGLELLFGLCNFDPVKRWSAMDVMNSNFMAPLREVPGTLYSDSAFVQSYTAFSTHC